jgi:4'-phosphopantetheinyl transferase
MKLIEEQWKSPPVDYRIDRNVMHIWRSRFRPNFLSDRKFVNCLSEQEGRKAERFVRQSDRDRYVFAHALLRWILGAYVSCEPQELIFETNQYGKPFLRIGHDGKDIQFNLSHSQDITLVAVARGASVGIDVEYTRAIPDARDIAERLFSADEREFLNSLPAVDFNDWFFTFWTLKEAFLKGIGMGLSYPLHKFSIIFPKSKADGAISISTDSIRAYDWSMMCLSLGPFYSGALAVPTTIRKPEFFCIASSIQEAGFPFPR